MRSLHEFGQGGGTMSKKERRVCYGEVRGPFLCAEHTSRRFYRLHGVYHVTVNEACFRRSPSTIRIDKRWLER